MNIKLIVVVPFLIFTSKMGAQSTIEKQKMVDQAIHYLKNLSSVLPTQLMSGSPRKTEN
jgi:hypothetical protein